MEAADPANPPLDSDTINFPVLATLASLRGNTLLEQVIKVEEKVAAFDPFYGALTGKRQALEDALDTIDLNGVDPTSEIAAIDENELPALSTQLLGL
jgi:hypothetical protein